MAHLRGDRLDALIEHFDVTAQRDQGDNKFGALFIKAAPERFTKTDGEALDANAAAASNPEMAKFMHRDQNTKRNNERRQIPENAQHKTFRQIVLKTSSNRQANTGTAAVRLSMRSSIPPWPGIR